MIIEYSGRKCRKPESNGQKCHGILLPAVIKYLAVVSEGMAEVPINIVRAMNEVEKIVKIEELVFEFIQ